MDDRLMKGWSAIVQLGWWRGALTPGPSPIGRGGMFGTNAGVDCGRAFTPIPSAGSGQALTFPLRGGRGLLEWPLSFPCARRGPHPWPLSLWERGDVLRQAQDERGEFCTEGDEFSGIGLGELAAARTDTQVCPYGGWGLRQGRYRGRNRTVGRDLRPFGCAQGDMVYGLGGVGHLRAT